MKKVSTSFVLAAAVLALTVPAAAATSFAGSRTGSRVGGDVSINSSRTDLSGTVWDTKADGHCGWLRGNWDRMWAPDHGFDVAKACGYGDHQYGYMTDDTDPTARDFEVRTNTGTDYKVVWEGTNSDA